MKSGIGSLLVLLVSITTHAQTTTTVTPGAGPNMFETLMPFAFIFVIFYFLIIRPQSKRAKEQQTFISALKRGDEVVTASGILGKIDGLTDQFVTLEVDQGVKLRILRSQIATTKLSELNKTTDKAAKADKSPVKP